jgi:tetratricopeptide (TPR) repeat protein
MKTKYIHRILLCAFLIICAFVHAQPLSNDSLKMDIFLNNSMLKDASIDVKLINAVDYTPTGFLFLASSNQFYMLGMGGMPSVFKKTKTVIDAFTVTQDNALWIVSGNKLYTIDEKENLSIMFNLPISKAGIVSGNDENVAYIYDRIFQKGKKGYAVYQISDKGLYAKLLSTPTPVLSVFEYKTSLLLSTENKILCADSKTKSFFDLFALPQKQDIISITGDTVNRAVYFSTQDTVYRIQGGKCEYICMEFGGILKYDGEGLLIFNPKESLIVRFRNNILYPPAVKKEENLPQIELSIDETPENAVLRSLLNEPRNLILNGQISQAIQVYAQLAGKDETNSALLSEYAYALALGGIYEGALMNLDRAKLLGTFSKKDYFYAGQVFALTGYKRPAIGFLNACSVPEWIYAKQNELYQKYKFAPQENGEDTLMFKRANYLASTGMYFQSIALYEQLLEEYPDESIVHVGYSIPLEKAGLRKLAAE